MRTCAWAVTLLAATAALAGGCGSGGTAGSESTSAPARAAALPQGAEPVTLDPADFTTEIDNPYGPMPVGRVWVYRETGADGSEQRVVVTVTDRTETIMGITARVVHDVVSEDGRPVEVTDDWYAQDRAGNVWYLGEATQEFEEGTPASTKGSWRAGVNGAQPGIALPAAPVPGMTYRQEYLKGEAEDAARVLRVGDRARVPAGSYDDVLVTEDTTPLEPDLVERKHYARGVGLVLAEDVSGGESREELLEVRGP